MFFKWLTGTYWFCRRCINSSLIICGNFDIRSHSYWMLNILVQGATMKQSLHITGQSANTCIDRDSSVLRFGLSGGYLDADMGNALLCERLTNQYVLGGSTSFDVGLWVDPFHSRFTLVIEGNSNHFAEGQLPGEENVEFVPAWVCLQNRNELHWRKGWVEGVDLITISQNSSDSRETRSRRSGYQRPGRCLQRRRNNKPNICFRASWILHCNRCNSPLHIRAANIKRNQLYQTNPWCHIWSSLFEIRLWGFRWATSYYSIQINYIVKANAPCFVE